MKILFNEGLTKGKILLNTTGIGVYRTKIRNSEQENISFKKKPGPTAKYFSNFDAGYVYPLFKSHKLTEETLNKCSINEIPTRLVQAAGNTYLWRFTAFLEEIFRPISHKYCKLGLNEYCQDSKNYIMDLMEWKNKITNKQDKKL